MMVAVLAVFGLCMGSFVNALVYRLRRQEIDSKTSEKYSILKGRSICPDCKHTLSAKDLIPVFSWLALSGRCRYCKKPISPQYPLVETATAIAFVLSYIYWPQELTGAHILDFLVWLGLLTGLIALAVYDTRWMILPNKIIFPMFTIVAGSILIQSILSSDYHLLITAATGAVVGGGIFYILFQISGGQWIGGGDVKLGFLLGAITGGPALAFLMLFLASLLGSIFSVPIILKKRLGSKAKIAFGPFLILSTVIVVLFGEKIIEQYNNLLML